MKTEKKVKREDENFDYSQFENGDDKWNVDKFLELEPYEYNRDVVPRMEKLLRRMSKGPLPNHLRVSIGVVTKPFSKYKTGDIFRFDGNTRSELWKIKPNMKPNVPLRVSIYYVGTNKLAKAIYDDLDNLGSAEKSNEKVTGLIRHKEYVPKSLRIRKGTFITAVNNACAYAHDDDGRYMNDKSLNEDFSSKMDFYWEEIKFLDNLNLDSLQKYSGNILTCLLLVAKKYGLKTPKLVELFENLRDEITTISTSTEMDGVHFVNNVLHVENIDTWTQTGYNNSRILISKILYGFDMFMRNESVRKKRKPPLSDSKFLKYYQEYMRTK